MLFAWSILAAFRLWRPEPSWIDRLGRIVGVYSAGDDPLDDLGDDVVVATGTRPVQSLLRPSRPASLRTPGRQASPFMQLFIKDMAMASTSKRRTRGFGENGSLRFYLGELHRTPSLPGLGAWLWARFLQTE